MSFRDCRCSKFVAASVLSLKWGLKLKYVQAPETVHEIMVSFLEEFEHLRIQLEDIKSATNNFGENKVIGGGGFGKVYLGEVSQSKGKSMGAFKRLDPRHGQGDPEFWKEIMMLSGYRHENLISLLGFCDEGGEKILVYEYASNRSLDRHLSSTHLTWRQRIKICLDAAKGLSYLHDDKGTMQRVIHRDIKSSNILLDRNWNAKVSDMGLSKIGPANQTHTFLFTHVAGTPGYCDPQYMKSYTLTKESDVYSFGVVLFEVLCGRLCYKYSNGELDILVPKWKKAYKQNKLHDIVFQDLVPPMNSTSLEKFSRIAFQCLQTSREKRPTMAHVVEELKIALESQKPPNKYEDGLKDVVYSLKYRSIKVVKSLLSKGVFFNGGETWFSSNDKGEHCEMISIAACLISPANEPDLYICGQYSNYESRFTSGSYITCGRSFKTHVKAQFLSPQVTYTVNLVFRCHKKLEEKATKQQQYIAIAYELKGEKNISRVHLADTSEDGWLIAELYKFTNEQSIVDLEIIFKSNPMNELEIEGIKFQPVDNVRRANNMEIMLTKVNMSLHDMMFAALTMDESILDGNQIENFIKFCPTEEEIVHLKNYSGDKEMLGKYEQFFLELMKVPRLESKLRVFLFKIYFNTQLSELKKSLNTINTTCDEVRNSVKLMEMRNLYLGNTLNQGTARGFAVGFKLDTLLKLTDTQASNSKMTSMHFFCKVVASKAPALLDFHVDLVSLESATKIQLKSLAEGMHAIIMGLEKVEQELDASANDGPVSQVFHKTLNEFFGFANSEVRSVISLYSEVGRNADALSLYFGADPAVYSFEQVVQTLSNFVRLFRKAHEENCKQAEIEKRERAQKEVEMEEAN